MFMCKGREKKTESNDEEEVNKGTRDNLGSELFPDTVLDSENADEIVSFRK